MVTTSQPISDRRNAVTLYNISWDTYESLLNDIGERRSWMTYNNGVLEIMPPVSLYHESDGQFIARMIELYSLELDIPIIGLGSTTWKRRDILKGLEADECYYIQHARQLGARRDMDINFDPPPDLAIEIDLSYVDVDKLEVYAGLGVPEVWRFKEGKLTIFRPQIGGQHQTLQQSEALPDLLPQIIEQHIALRNRLGEHEAIKLFRDWIRHGGEER